MTLASSSVLALASAASYALALVLAQIGLRHQSALAGATVSLPTTAAALWLVALASLDLHGFEPRAAALFVGIGVLFPVAVTILSFESNRHLGPNIAGALGNATPVIAVLFGVLILGETLTFDRGLGLALIVGGVVLLSTRGRLDARRWSRWALLLPFSAALIRGLVQPLMKLGLALWPEPLAATLIGYTISAAVILAVASARGERPGRNLHPKGAPVFAMVGLLNGGSVLLMYSALARDRVSLVAPLIAVYPLFTLAFGAILLRGERLHVRLIAGIVLTVLGVAVTVAS
jgi:drug/metabolite transporter (DMT)-like permease